jgi:transposase
MLWFGEGRPTIPTLAIRDDIGSEELRRQARRETDGRISARLIAIAKALEGMDRANAARLAGMDRQTLRDWVHRYNAEGIAGLCLLNEAASPHHHSLAQRRGRRITLSRHSLHPTV